MREASQSDVGEGLEEETPGSCKGPRAMPLEMLGKGAPSTGKAHPKRFACGLFEGMSKNAAWLHSNSIFKITVEKKNVFSTQIHLNGKETLSSQRMSSDLGSSC